MPMEVSRQCSKGNRCPGSSRTGLHLFLRCCAWGKVDFDIFLLRKALLCWIFFKYFYYQIYIQVIFSSALKGTFCSTSDVYHQLGEPMKLPVQRLDGKPTGPEAPRYCDPPCANLYFMPRRQRRLLGGHCRFWRSLFTSRATKATIYSSLTPPT